jgi:hypothetical protein
MTASNTLIKIEKGRILRVKQGYNPNSSSMGSMIFVLPVSMLAATVCFGAVSGLIMSAAVKRKAGDVPDTCQTADQEESQK